MKFKDAIEKSIRRYHAGEMPEEAIEASKEQFVYTPEYFDKLLEEEIPEDKGDADETKDA
jgi:hypothetical protein